MPDPETATRRQRDQRLGLRTTQEERELIDRAVEVVGTDVTEFVVSSACDAARRILADRDEFKLASPVLADWERVNRRRPRELAGLRKLMRRPSPFRE
jgi:uncharacterized protein (DUF1778 family)